MALLRSLLTGCLALVLIAPLAGSASAGAAPVRVFVDDTPSATVTAAVLNGDILYFPLRALATSLHAVLVVDGPDLQLRRADSRVFVVRVGRREVWADGQVIALAEGPALLTGGVTMVAHGAVEAIFDALVVWDRGSNTATIITRTTFQPAEPERITGRQTRSAATTKTAAVFAPEFQPDRERPVIASGTFGMSLSTGGSALALSSRVAFLTQGGGGTISGAFGFGTGANAPVGAQGVLTWRRASSVLTAGVFSLHDSPFTLYEQGLIGLVYDQNLGRIQARLFGGVLPSGGGTVYGMSIRLPRVGALLAEATLVYSPETSTTIARARLDWGLRPGLSLFGEAAYGTSSTGSGMGWRVGVEYSSRVWTASISYLSLAPGFPALGNASLFAARHGPVIELAYHPNSRWMVLASAALLTGAPGTPSRLAYRLFTQYQISPALSFVAEARSTDEPVNGVRMRRDTAQASLLFTSGRWSAALTAGTGIDEQAGRTTANSVSVSLRAGYTLRNGWPVWTELTWLGGDTRAWALGAGTRIQLNPRFDLTAQVRAKLVTWPSPSTEAALEVGVVRPLASGAQLSVGAGVKITSSSPSATPYLTIGYTRPFTIFGPLRVGRVAVDVYVDANANARRDPEESGVAGVVIRIDARSAARTDPAGRFTVEGVREGEYRVSVDESTLPLGLIALQPEARVRVAADGRSAVAFGLTPAATLRCLVYLDENANGMRDRNEQGVSDVVAGLQPLGRRAISDLDGTLAFGDLRPGTYTVAIDPRALPSTVKLSGSGIFTTTLAAGATATCELAVQNAKSVVITFP